MTFKMILMIAANACFKIMQIIEMFISTVYFESIN